jgi:hypothetical protein
MMYAGDWGHVFTATFKDQDGVVVDISSASVKELIFRKPNGGAVLTKAATFVTSGADGKAKYTTVAGDINAAGEWLWRGHVTLASGSWNTPEARFTVEAIVT